MISNPGDNRTALIAALIAIPAAALISMGVHTFVPVEQKPNVTVIASSSEAPQEGKMGFRKGPRGEAPRGNFNKEDFKKRFMEIRKARFDALKKIVDLSKKRVELLSKQQKKACPKALNAAQCDYLLAESAMYRQTARIRLEGVCVSDLAVKAVCAEKLAAASKKAAKSGVISESAALENEIAALQLKLQISNQRLSFNPAWKAAYEAFQKEQTVANLQAMLNAEKEAAPRRMPGAGPQRRFRK